MNWLMQIAPTIATALGGPLAGAAAEFLASKLGASDKTVEGIQQTLSGMTGADLVKLKELDLDFQKHMSDNGISLQMAQIEVNKEEAKSPSFWVAGWRPSVGWICSAALFYEFLAHPLLIGSGYASMPDLPVEDLMTLLFGMLGLGAFRTVEKVKGVA